MAPRQVCYRAVTVACAFAQAAAAWNETATVYNHGNLTYPAGEPVRLQVDLAGLNASQVAVSIAGVPVWSQIEVLSGSPDRIGAAHLWVTAALAPGDSATFEITLEEQPPTPPTPPPVSGSCNGSNCTLGTDTEFVIVSSSWSGPGTSPPPPLLGVSYGGNGTLRGGSMWAALPAGGWELSAFSSILKATGPVFAEALLEYSFSSPVATAFASWRVRTYAPTARPGPLIIERHNLSIDAGVELLMGGSGAAAPWAPTTHVGQPWFYCNRSLAIDPNGWVRGRCAASGTCRPSYARLCSGR